MFDPCEKCKQNCNTCKVHNDLMQYKKTNFRLNYQLRRKAIQIQDMTKKLGIANKQISNLREEKSKRW